MNSANVVGAEENVDTKPSVSRVISLESGQLLSIAVPQRKQTDQNAFVNGSNGDEKSVRLVSESLAGKALKEYGRRAFPLAKKHGLKTEFTFSVSKVILGKYQPASVVLFSWPDQLSETAFTREEQWPEIKALRPQAWDELKIYTSELQAGAQFQFSSDKYYTLAIAWFSIDNPTDYDQYMKNIKGKVDDVGGRFLFKLRTPEYESIADKRGAPGQVTLVEWPNREALAQLQSSDIYKSNSALFTRGVSQFEFYVVEPKL